MNICFHGAAEEVGRSCIVINNSIMLDCGLKVGKHEQMEFHQFDSGSHYENFGYPTTLKYNDIAFALISHAHLDHCGALPLFNKFGMNVPIFMTDTTKKISEVLMNDALKIAKQENHDFYSSENIQSILREIKNVNQSSQDKRVEHIYDDYKFEFFNSGHIPGSSSVLLNVEGIKLLYSGDINYSETRLMKKAEKLPEADILITECTYGDREHPKREFEEDRFLGNIDETLKRNGSVLIPVFAVGRAQEILLLLSERNYEVPIYLDGMAKQITEIVMKTKNPYVKNVEKLKKFMKNVIVVDNKSRDKYLNHQGIFVTTSGMCTGGPVMDYLHSFHNKSSHSIFLTGYQSPDSNGHSIWEHRSLVLDNKRYDIRCQVEKFDFSAHSGRSDLIKMIRDVNPKILILNHGDKKSIQSLKDEFSGKIKVMIPKLGEELDV